MKVQRVFSTKQVDRRVRRVSRSVLTNQTNEIRIKRIILSLVLTFAVFAMSLPTSVAQDDLQSAQTTEQLIASFEQSFEAELTAYAATHTDAQVRAYAQARLNQLTAEGLDDSFANSTTAISTYPEPYWYGDPDFGDYEFCISTRTEECRRLYNGELFSSAATSTAIFAGCVGLTTGTGLIVCAAAALAVHAANIAAARQRHQACLTRAYSDCALQYQR